ncbi:hypothetical protein C8R46DRAFT_1345070 [Mycena filopes]|nr:hypothetical protein C8R46DRAFT_1345070 [Mycena filopes]
MVRPESANDYRVYGFVVHDDVLLKYALRNKLGTDEDEWQKCCAIGNALDKLLRVNKIDPYLVAGVMVDGDVRTCAAIASEDWHDRMPMPPQETIDKLKKMMGTDQDPRWYVHA